MTYTQEDYYCALLFLLSIHETDIYTLEVGNLDGDSVIGYLEMLANLGFAEPSKSDYFITPIGKVHLNTHLDLLKDKLVAFVKKRKTDISDEVDITEFMVSNFIKPNPKSNRTTNDRDFGVYFIKYLKSKNLIKYDEINLSHINYWCIDDNPPTTKMWFDNLNLPLCVELTSQSSTPQVLVGENILKKPESNNVNILTIIAKTIKNIKNDQWSLLIDLFMLAIAMYWVFKQLS